MEKQCTGDRRNHIQMANGIVTVKKYIALLAGGLSTEGKSQEAIVGASRACAARGQEGGVMTTPVERKNGKLHVGCEAKSGRFNPGVYCTSTEQECEQQGDWDNNPDSEITNQTGKVQQLRETFAVMERELRQEEAKLTELLRHQEFLRMQTHCEYKRWYSQDYPSSPLSSSYHEYELGRRTR